MSDTAESGHWYDVNGNPCYTQITASGKNKGKERNTTLRDARKLNLVPSVTTILGIQSKPMLTRWLVDQALMAALTLPKIPGESLDDFKKRAAKDADAHRDEAATTGSAIHADIERGFNGEAMGKYAAAYDAVMEQLNIYYPGVKWKAEESFCHPLGFGGKIDLNSDDGQGIMVDFKTKDDLDNKKIKQIVYPDHGMQLSAYAMGKGYTQPDRMSLFIDRADCSKAKIFQWDAASHKQHEEMFYTLLHFWKVSKQHFPEVAV